MLRTYVYIPAKIYTKGKQACRRAGVQGGVQAGVQVCRRAGRRAGVQACRQACRRAGVQAGVQVCRRAGRRAGGQGGGRACGHIHTHMHIHTHTHTHTHHMHTHTHTHMQCLPTHIMVELVHISVIEDEVRISKLPCDGIHLPGTYRGQESGDTGDRGEGCTHHKG